MDQHLWLCFLDIGFLAEVSNRFSTDFKELDVGFSGILDFRNFLFGSSDTVFMGTIGLSFWFLHGFERFQIHIRRVVGKRWKKKKIFLDRMLGIENQPFIAMGFFGLLKNINPIAAPLVPGRKIQEIISRMRKSY